MKSKIWLAAFAVAACVLAGGAARADDDHDRVGPRPGVSLGGRAAYYRPKGADNGSLNGGAQLRLHMTSVLALEGSVDYRQNKFGGTTVDSFPVQASLMIYLLPGMRVSPYILGGGGWYYSHVKNAGGETTTNHFGPHAGAGLQVFLDRHWSVDGSYRYLWNEDVHSQDAAHPLGQNFSDQGYMLTAALNYHF